MHNVPCDYSWVAHHDRLIYIFITVAYYDETLRFTAMTVNDTFGGKHDC